MKRLIVVLGIFLAACGQAPVQTQFVKETRVIEQPVEVTSLVSQLVGAVSVERYPEPTRKVTPQMAEVTNIVSQTVVVTANVESYIVPIIKVTPQMVEVTRIVQQTVEVTRLVTIEPEQKVIEPTVDSESSATPQSETGEGNIIFEFRGEGSGTSDLFSLPTGIIKVYWRNEGEGYTSIDIKNLDNDLFWEFLDAGVGPFEGQHILNVKQSDKYLFDASSSGGIWYVWIEHIE